jgi:hypothetical protein
VRRKYAAVARPESLGVGDDLFDPLLPVPRLLTRFALLLVRRLRLPGGPEVDAVVRLRAPQFVDDAGVLAVEAVVGSLGDRSR